MNVELTMLQALNLEMLVEARIKEIDEAAEKFPNLPMKDPHTYASYVETLEKLQRARDAYVQNAGVGL
jgi:hypothetical protein